MDFSVNEEDHAQTMDKESSDKHNAEVLNVPLEALARSEQEVPEPKTE